jgi:hypothetical protein
MRRNDRYVLPCVMFAAMALLTAWISSCRMSPSPASLAMEDWDVPQLTAYLRSAGVEVYTLPCQRNGVEDLCAYLSVTKKEWRDVNGLSKSPNLIHEWRGIAYCARESARDTADLAAQWGDRCLRIGPFICYGDAELLARIDAAVNRSRPVVSS